MRAKHPIFLLCVAMATAFAGAATGADAGLLHSKGNCSGPSFGLIRQTESIDTPGPFVDGYVFADGFESEQPLLQWADVFGSEFPTRSASAELFIQNGKFVALAFATGSRSDPAYAENDGGALQLGIGVPLPAAALISISTCPGDFSTAPGGSANCQISPPGASINWQLTGGNTSQFACPLQENTTYFLNLALVEPNNGATTCQGSAGYCALFVETR